MRRKDKEDAVGLTEEQCDVLDWLCTVRHEMHSNQEDMFYAESSNNEKFLKWIESEINETLQKVNLPKINLPDVIDCPDNFIYYEMKDEYGWEDIDDARNECIDFMKEVNTKIEEYLAKIDEEHNTHYCPTGASRIF